MKAVVIINGKEITVEGKDLTIDTNMFSNELTVFDRASESNVFTCNRNVVDYAYIVTGGEQNESN